MDLEQEKKLHRERENLEVLPFTAIVTTNKFHITFPPKSLEKKYNFVWSSIQTLLLPNINKKVNHFLSQHMV